MQSNQNAAKPTRGRLPAWSTSLLCLCALLLPAGCRRSTPQADPQAPARLLARLQQAHQERRYKELESLVDPRQSHTLVRTLMAVDRLLEASSRLQQAAERHVGATAAVVCDLRVLADFLGPFSRNVQIITTRIEGDTAWVTYQVGERVPVERAQVRLVDGRWLYLPDDADADLPDILQQLSDRLIELRQAAEAGTYSERDFLDQYARRIREPLAMHLARAAGAKKDKSAADR